MEANNSLLVKANKVSSGYARAFPFLREEIYAEGRLALAMALDNYDKKKNASISAHVYRVVRFHVITFLRSELGFYYNPERRGVPKPLNCMNSEVNNEYVSSKIDEEERIISRITLKRVLEQMQADVAKGKIAAKDMVAHIFEGKPYSQIALETGRAESSVTSNVFE